MQSIKKILYMGYFFKVKRNSDTNVVSFAVRTDAESLALAGKVFKRYF